MSASEEEKSAKIARVLGIYTKLQDGCIVSKAEEAVRYGVTERSIQRDIDDIRRYLENASAENGNYNSVSYSRSQKGYRLERVRNLQLTNSEILAVCKILLDSRAFMKSEMKSILNKLISCCIPQDNRKLIEEMIGNEAFHYVELRHSRDFIDLLWEIGQAVRECRYISMDYVKPADKTATTRKVKPVGIMFSEYYFYMTAFIEDKDMEACYEANGSFPTIYRVDRIEKLKVLDEKFHIPYSSRFEEGEFRKRVQFMYGGKLQHVKFKYKGYDVDAVLDRLPTAKILAEENGVYTIETEVFGTGIDMWLRSQGDFVERIQE